MENPISAAEPTCIVNPQPVVDGATPASGEPQMKHTGEHALTPKQFQAIMLLVQGRSITAVAHELGIDRTTVHRWHQLPAFAAELERSKQEVAATARARLLGLGLTAVETLEEIMTDGSNDLVRVRAAQVVLSNL